MEDLTKILQYAGESIIEPPHGSEKKIQKVKLYKLVITPPKDAWAGYKLPDKYEKITNEAVFAIPSEAILSIKYLLMEGPVQMYNPITYGAGYDTAIRESLMKIGQVMIDKALMLACDYYFDEETKYYAREPKCLSRGVLLSLIIYKFWNGRTGRGLQSIYANIDESQYPFSKDIINSYYYITQEIKHYEKIQEKDIVKKIYKDSKQGGSMEEACVSLGEIKKEFKLFEANVSYLMYGASGGGGTKIKISCESKDIAKKIALNDFYKAYDTITPALQKVDVEILELNKPDFLELKNQGVIDF